MMAAAEEIGNILLEALANEWNYCAICLRTSNQRKLVQSDLFVLLAKRLRLRPPSNMNLCFICSAHVWRAWKTLHAVSFASTINTWFQSAPKQRLQNKQSLKEDLIRVTKLLTFGEHLSLEQYWGEVRARSALAATEPLYIGCDPNEKRQENLQPKIPQNTTTEAPPAKVPSPEVVNPVSLHSLTQKPDSDCIVIIEDDDDTPPLSPKLVTMEELLDEPKPKSYSLTADCQQLMARDEDEQNSVILYPVYLGIDQNKYVPLLNLKIEQDKFKNVTSVCFVDESELTKNVYEDIRYDMKKNYVMNYKGDTYNVKVIDKVLPKVAPNVATDEPRIPARQAIMNEKVDWEDKIPMDVISFVDATDPNAEEYLNVDPNGLLMSGDTPQPQNHTAPTAGLQNILLVPIPQTPTFLNRALTREPTKTFQLQPALKRKSVYKPRNLTPLAKLRKQASLSYSPKWLSDAGKQSSTPKPKNAPSNLETTNSRKRTPEKSNPDTDVVLSSDSWQTKSASRTSSTDSFASLNESRTGLNESRTGLNECRTGLNESRTGLNDSQVTSNDVQTRTGRALRDRTRIQLPDKFKKSRLAKCGFIIDLC